MKKISDEKHVNLEHWFPVKEQKHNTEPKKLPKITEGEVWWTAVGENVGVEINGKSDYSCAVLSQAKIFSTARLYNRLGQIAEDDMEIIKTGFSRLFLGK